MANLRKLIEDTYIDLGKFSKKIYDGINPGLKINHKRKKFYVEKDGFLANAVGISLIILGYYTDFSS